MKNRGVVRPSKKAIIVTSISLSVLSGLFFSNQTLTKVSAANVSVGLNSDAGDSNNGSNISNDEETIATKTQDVNQADKDPNQTLNKVSAMGDKSSENNEETIATKAQGVNQADKGPNQNLNNESAMGDGSTENSELTGELAEDSNVNYTINYVDSKDTSHILDSKTGTAKGGYNFQVPNVLVAGYSSKINGASTVQIQPVTTEALKNQTFTVSLDAMEDVVWKTSSLEYEDQRYIEDQGFYLKNNDVNYRQELDKDLNYLQQGRKIQTIGIYSALLEWESQDGSFTDLYAKDIPALAGMDTVTVKQFLDAGLDYFGFGQYLPDKVSRLEFVFFYAPITKPYVINYYAEGGKRDGQLLYTETDPKSMEPTPGSPGHYGLYKHPVVGYSKGAIDERYISYEENDDSAVLNYRVYAKDPTRFVVTQHDPDGKDLGTYSHYFDVNETIDWTDDSLFDGVFNGSIDKENSYWIDMENGEEYKYSFKLLFDKIPELNSNLPDSKVVLELVKYLYKRIYNWSTVPESISGETTQFDLVLKPLGKTGNNNSNGSNSGSHSHSSNSNSGNKVDSDTLVYKNQNIATTNRVVELLEKDGTLVTNRALGKNTAWFSDQELTHNNILYYRVATDEWVRAKEVYVYEDTSADVVRVHGDGTLVDFTGKAITNRRLGIGTDWKTDRIALINGERYYRVSTNEFLSVNDGYVINRA